MELEEKADIVVDKYSGGMNRRLELARGFIHHPKVLFLDEPTLGLDTQTRRRTWDYIKELNEREGVTIVLTTHYLEEAEYLCDRVGIIDQGTIIVLESPKKVLLCKQKLLLEPEFVCVHPLLTQHGPPIHCQSF